MPSQMTSNIDQVTATIEKLKGRAKQKAGEMLASGRLDRQGHDDTASSQARLDTTAPKAQEPRRPARPDHDRDPND